MRTWLEKILQTSLQMESKISIAQIINDMICVKVDKAPQQRSASARCPPSEAAASNIQKFLHNNHIMYISQDS